MRPLPHTHACKHTGKTQIRPTGGQRACSGVCCCLKNLHKLSILVRLCAHILEGQLAAELCMQAANITCRTYHDIAASKEFAIDVDLWSIRKGLLTYWANCMDALIRLFPWKGSCATRSSPEGRLATASTPVTRIRRVQRICLHIS